MTNHFDVNPKFLPVFVFVILLFFINQNIFAAQYPEMKVILKSGATIEGDDGSIDGSSVTMKVDGESKVYPFSDVQLVMVKKGLGGTYALAAGGGCAALVLISIIAASRNEKTEYSTGQLVAGGLIWVAIFAGGGYLIGNAADDWDTIYISPAQSSILQKFKLGFAAHRKGELRIGLSYSF